MNDTDKLKAYSTGQLGLDLVGVCDAVLLEDEPRGHRPSDILPGAKSIVVFGKAMPDGSVQAAFRHFEDGHPTARGSYTAYGADLAPNFTLFFATFELSRYIEREIGGAAAPLPCGPMQCGVPNSVAIPAFAAPFRVGLPLNIDKAAYGAGLGDYGWSGRLLTEEYGPRIHFGGVVTQRWFDADKPWADKHICKGETCLACVRHCPAKALSLPGADDKGSVRTVGVAGAERKVSAVKLNKCIVAACALRKEYGGEDDFCSEDPTDTELEGAFERKPINNFEGLDHYPKWKCDRCLLYCCAGKWKEKFFDRGLTEYE